MGAFSFDTQKDTRSISEFLDSTTKNVQNVFNTADKSKTLDRATDANTLKTAAIAGGIGLLIGGVLAWMMKA